MSGALALARPCPASDGGMAGKELNPSLACPGCKVLSKLNRAIETQWCLAPDPDSSLCVPRPSVHKGAGGRRWDCSPSHRPHSQSDYARLSINTFPHSGSHLGLYLACFDVLSHWSPPTWQFLSRCFWLQGGDIQVLVCPASLCSVGLTDPQDRTQVGHFGPGTPGAMPCP